MCKMRSDEGPLALYQEQWWLSLSNLLHGGYLEFSQVQHWVRLWGLFWSKLDFVSADIITGLIYWKIQKLTKPLKSGSTVDSEAWVEKGGHERGIVKGLPLLHPFLLFLVTALCLSYVSSSSILWNSRQNEPSPMRLLLSDIWSQRLQMQLTRCCAKSWSTGIPPKQSG